ncbi:Niemann-Pick C1 protein [Thelohanellus kitauei]|uniref:Niemann-Pick C1 protein n=1 Tax=Thelohanellus kitauei TaxID=669202 RepID=A0A0C2IXB5_THEKT|nr:Niemann-Pick C1 protein [Thelohanellus kitauei]
MSFQTSLVKSEDFISAMAIAQTLSKNITKTINHTVMPYSIFHIYYESYHTIWRDVLVCFCLSFVVVTIVNAFLFAFDLRMIIIMTCLTFLMSIVDMGYMHWTGMNLNPVSLVNLIMLVGINVEFLSHIGRSYLFSRSTSRLQRAVSAFVETGSAVFVGITLTKVLGIAVLSITKSELFKEYYFKMYMGAILIAALHGLVALPIILSYVGPLNKYTIEENDDLVLFGSE